MSNIAAFSPDSPFLDPAALRIPTGARHSEQRKRAAASALIVRRPNADEWVFVHPDPLFHWENFWCYEKDKTHFMVVPDVYEELESSVSRVFAEWDFYLASVLNGDPIIWPVKHSDTDYFRTIREAVQAAMTGWLQVQSNQNLKRYDYRHATGNYPAPDWSGFQTAQDAGNLFTKTFRERLIMKTDHEVLERLRGRK